jgi:hypothetical protein
MKSFAPMPISALTGNIVPFSAFRLLGHLLGLRTLFEFRDEFSVTDYEQLKGYRDRKSGTQLQKETCPLSDYRLD